jgi:glycosyltransferase involved in cell wall biosynthesis
MQRKSLLYIGNKLSAKGVTVTSIETLGTFLKNEGYTVYTASSKKNKILRLADMLLAVIRYSRKVGIVLIDTYSTQNFYFAVAVANVCRMIRIPYIPILRGGDLPARLKKSKRHSFKLFGGAKTNVAPSRYLLQEFKTEGYTNLTYIPNTIQLENYPFLLRKAIRTRILWVRSFAGIYNPELALEILELLIAEGIDAEMCMVGPEKDGSLARCKQIAETKRLPVSFPGKLSKPQWIELSSDYDIFINTTNFDNTPVSVIEAMALGLPVISTRVGGVPYLIEDGVDGILVPANNASAFVTQIKRFIHDPDTASGISEKARKKVTAFDWEKVKGMWFQILDA